MVEADCPGTTIAVHRGDWAHLAPELVAMLAPPISVSSAPLAAAPPRPPQGSRRRAQQARSRANMPVGRLTRSTR